MMKRIWFSSLVFMMCSKSDADVLPRIESLRFDKSKVEKMYLAPGLSSILIFPCPIEEAVSGRREDLRSEVSPNNKRKLILSLKSTASLATNLIVSCGNEKSMFVFDVIPSKRLHQDIIEIRSSFNRPNQISNPPDTTKKITSKRIILKNTTLFASGGHRK